MCRIELVLQSAVKVEGTCARVGCCGSDGHAAAAHWDVEKVAGQNQAIGDRRGDTAAEGRVRTDPADDPNITCYFRAALTVRCDAHRGNEGDHHAQPARDY